eukprot:CAMPEP_0185740946 /NCGR_PEP_ID=MMETSP1171-20130828/38695_1 /TAXON_ID=374046 /ORGANISM="Helicotheca tamensis, Strain CCMP826" /LENGTH=333 /DNA_ID=CAMNT_0028412879 /DNA_START=114 /DNA_END=1115 /DNA_ORIENTATION=-
MAPHSDRSSSVALFLALLAFLAQPKGSVSTMAFVAQSHVGRFSAFRYSSERSAMNRLYLRRGKKSSEYEERDSSYSDRLREAASSPEAFEKFVMKGVTNDTIVTSTQEETSEDAPISSRGGESPKKKGYQRAEEWEAELNERRKGKGSGMTSQSYRSSNSIALFLVALSAFFAQSEGSMSTMAAFVAQPKPERNSAFCSSVIRREQMTQVYLQRGRESIGHDERDSSYFDRLREASSSPEAFDKFVMKGVANDAVVGLTQEENSEDSPILTRGEEPPKKKGYQRAEEWEAELDDRRKGKGSGMTWEEKVQFDGQRFGNQIRQDAILRKHLGSF